MPSLKECQRIKAMDHDLAALIQKYKGTFYSEQGNKILDALDHAQFVAAGLEQSAFDEMRRGK